MQRKLLHICNDLPYWSAHRRAIAEAAREKNWDVSVATAAHPDASELASAGFGHIALPIDRFGLNPVADARVLLSILRSTATSRFDAIHLFTIKPLLLGGLAARAARPWNNQAAPRIIGTVAGLGRALEADAGWRAKATLWGLATGLGRTADAITFENPGDRDFYVTHAAFDPERTHVFPGAGIDLREFVPNPARRSASAVTILHAGRLLRSKGVMDLVGAAKILRARFGKGLRLAVAGMHTDDDPDGLTHQERALLETTPEIDFLGPQRPSDMPALMAAADIFVLPTRYPEGLPRVLLEAAATGAALVAGSVDGTRAFIDHESNGLLLEDTDAGTIAAALARLVADAPLRRRLGIAAREKLEQGGYDIRAVAARFLGLYEHSG